MRKRCACRAVLSMLLLWGCASDVVRVQSLQSDPYPHSAPVLPGGGPKVTVSEFVLATGTSPTTVGEAKTGLFNFRTPVIADQPANLMVTEGVRKGLKAAGVELVEPPDADYRVDGQVEKFWVEEYATGLSLEYAKASVRFDVYVRDRKGDLAWVKSVEEFKVSGKSPDATQDDIPTLGLALREAVRAIVDDPGFRRAVSK